MIEAQLSYFVFKSESIHSKIHHVYIYLGRGKMSRVANWGTNKLHVNE